jgi:long-chain acyl-CoA synthetase
MVDIDTVITFQDGGSSRIQTTLKVATVIENDGSAVSSISSQTQRKAS